MKRCILYCFALLGMIRLQAQDSVIEKKIAQTEIIIGQQADSMTQKAASELQFYLLRISEVSIPLKHKAGDSYPIFIGSGFLTGDQKKQLGAAKGDDAFIICISSDGAYLAGKTTLGDLYAVYTLLESQLSCIKFNSVEEYVPRSDVMVLPVICKVYDPAFRFRVPHFEGRWDESFSQWHKISSFDNWGLFVHTFQQLVPPDTYFDDHPEYFARVNGRRLKDGQVCLSNPDLIKLLIENLGNEIAQHPEKVYWSVSQNDCYNYCECDSCQKMYDSYGAISGAYVEMANKLAVAFPDKQISTLAYQFTRSAPKNIRPLENVNIMFCSIECNRSMPLACDPRSEGFVTEMKEWSKLTHNIFAWDYVVQFKNYLTPFPNFHVLQPNIQFFQQNGVEMMFQQGSGASWSDLSDVKQYLIAKLLWDPGLDADSIVNQYMQYYYGKAAPFIRSYFELTHEALIKKQHSQQLDIYGFPVFYSEAHLSPELLLQYQQLMDSAEMAVEEDSIYLKRVLRARIPADFALLDIALNRPNAIQHWIDTVDGILMIDSSMVIRLDRFVALCALTGVTRINERNFKPGEYRAFTMRKLNWQIKDNKLKHATLELHTSSSPKYPVGGTGAIADGLLGGLDFRFNWLGFEGEDMLLVADLGWELDCHRIQMNFLKDVNSWIFLPTSVVVEFSTDGKQYHVVGTLYGDNEDRSYLVKSVPFVMDFNPQKARYIRIKATSMKTNPEWHRGFGRPSWIFVDEVIVE